MAVYSTVRNGSRNSDVSTLQSTLNSKGYSLDVDGIFGKKTEAAVRDYQSRNNLAVDGIVGANTWTSLTAAPAAAESTASSSTPAAAPATPAKAPDYSGYQYDASANDAYTKAMAELEAAKGNAPSYDSRYQGKIDELYQQIVDREPFSYDLNNDMLYQQAKEAYQSLGKTAMADTMGQAAALTGGYGSSYAQSAGQQQYNAYLQALNENVPEYYQLARDAYDADTQALYQNLSMTQGLEDTDYGRYRDQYQDYMDNLSYLTDRADTAYDRGYESWLDSYNLGMANDQFAYEKQQDAYSNLMSVITGAGYNPTDDELTAAGMTRAQANALISAYQAAQTPATGGSSGGGSSRRSSGKKSSGSKKSSGDDTMAYSGTTIKKSTSEDAASYYKSQVGNGSASARSTAWQKTADKYGTAYANYAMNAYNKGY